MVRKLLSTPVLTFAALFLFLAGALIFPRISVPDQIDILFGATSFIFGTIVAFFISVGTTRLNEIGQLLNREDANYITLYRISAVFGKETQEGLREFLDKYLQSQIDHYLADFERTYPEYESLSKFVISLDPKTEAQKIVYQTIVDVFRNIQENRLRVISLVKQGLHAYEWITIGSLASIILFCIFALNNGTVVSVAISVLLSTSVVLLILVLRDVTNLRWKEAGWIWICLKETFKEIGLTPYFPKSVITEGRAKLLKGEKIRVATYQGPYLGPESKKTVEEIAGA